MSQLSAARPAAARPLAAHKTAGLMSGRTVMASAQPIATPIGHPTAVPMSRFTAGAISRATPSAQPVALPMASSVAAATVPTTTPGGMNLSRPAPPRTNPNNLLAGGRVIEERVVDTSELLSSGKLIEAPAVRDQAYRASAVAATGLVGAPIATTLTEVVATPTVINAAPVVATEVVGVDPMPYIAQPITEVFVQP